MGKKERDYYFLLFWLNIVQGETWEGSFKTLSRRKSRGSAHRVLNY